MGFGKNKCVRGGKGTHTGFLHFEKVILGKFPEFTPSKKRPKHSPHHDHRANGNVTHLSGEYHTQYRNEVKVSSQRRKKTKKIASI